MQDDEQKKEPVEMTTDEALDYLFHPRIAERLRREAGKFDEPDSESDECESD